MLHLSKKSRAEVENLFFYNKITTQHYNAFAKRWNKTHRYGGYMRTYRVITSNPYYGT